MTPPFLTAGQNIPLRGEKKMLIQFGLILLLTPLLELFLLLQVGRYLGVWPTVALVFITGIVGVFLAQSQGLSLLSRLQSRLIKGELPTDDLYEGLFILLGGILLLTPGLITDTLGFLLLLPASRMRVKGWLEKKLRQCLDQGQIFFGRRF
jgi:UPF0716 protein FxsA